MADRLMNLKGLKKRKTQPLDAAPEPPAREPPSQPVIVDISVAGLPALDVEVVVDGQLTWTHLAADYLTAVYLKHGIGLQNVGDREHGHEEFYESRTLSFCRVTPEDRNELAAMFDPHIISMQSDPPRPKVFMRTLVLRRALRPVYILLECVGSGNGLEDATSVTRVRERLGLPPGGGQDDDALAPCGDFRLTTKDATQDHELMRAASVYICHSFEKFLEMRRSFVTKQKWFWMDGKPVVGFALKKEKAERKEKEMPCGSGRV